MLKLYNIKQYETNIDFGSKGNGLRLALAGGLPIPETLGTDSFEVKAFLLSIDAFLPAVKDWREWDGSSEFPESLLTLGKHLKHSFAPEWWKKAHRTLLMMADTEYLIFRSSMSCEDGKETAFAGSFNSIKARRTDAAACWQAYVSVIASCYSLSAAKEILSVGIDPEMVCPNAIVQPYVEADISGIAFSQHPTQIQSGESQNSRLVQWVKGAGQALADGTVLPDESCLSDSCPGALAEHWDDIKAACRKAEELLGTVADVEWVVKGQKFFLVQMRSVNTPEARLLAQSDERIHWSRELTIERFPDPISPLGWSAVSAVFESSIRFLDTDLGLRVGKFENVVANYKGYIYANDEVFSNPRIKWSFIAKRFFTHLRSMPILALQLFRLLFWKPSIRLAVSWLALRIFLILWGRAASRIARGWSQTYGQAKQAVVDQDLDQLSNGMASAQLKALKENAKIFFESDFAVYIIKEGLFQQLHKLWKELGLEDRVFFQGTDSFAGNCSMDLAVETSQLSSALARMPEGKVFLKSIMESGKVESTWKASLIFDLWNQFIEKHGDNTLSWDIAKPVWSQDPKPLAQMILAQLESKTTTFVYEQDPARKVGSHIWDDYLNGKVPNFIRNQLIRSLDLLHTFMKIDEEQHFTAGSFVASCRRRILDSEKRLLALNRIKQKDHIFALHLETVIDCLDGLATFNHNASTERQMGWYQKSFRWDPPRKIPENQNSSREGQKKGPIPMSGGIAEGRPKLDSDMDDVSGVSKGDIVICLSPNPALTPLYPKIAGIITMSGGLLSHGFVAAREYSLPAISGVENLESLVSAKLIRMNGHTGKIEVIHA